MDRISPKPPSSGPVEYGTALQEDIAAVTVVPERKGYARQKGWIEEGEAYDVEAVVESLRERVRASRRTPRSNTSAFREFRRKRNSPNTSNDWPERTIRASSSSAVRTSAAS